MRLLREQSANSMIEVALTLPFFIVMLLGVLDFGLVLQQAMLVADSARAGAEFGIQRGNALNLAGMQTVAKASAGNVPGYSVVAADVCTCGTNAAVSCSSGCGAFGPPAQYAQVTAKANLPIIFQFQGFQTTIPVQSVARVRIAWVNPKCPTC